MDDLQKVIERNAAAQPDIITGKADPIDYQNKEGNDDPQPVDDKALRISALETQVSLLQEAINNADARTQGALEGLLELRDAAQEPKHTALSVGGFNFTISTLPKQDAMVAGVNSVGRPGLVLQASDGDRTYTLAKVAWDHNKQTFVLYAGVGATS